MGHEPKCIMRNVKALIKGDNLYDRTSDKFPRLNPSSVWDRTDELDLIKLKAGGIRGPVNTVRKQLKIDNRGTCYSQEGANPCSWEGERAGAGILPKAAITKAPSQCLKEHRSPLIPLRSAQFVISWSWCPSTRGKAAHPNGDVQWSRTTPLLVLKGKEEVSGVTHSPLRAHLQDLNAHARHHPSEGYTSLTHMDLCGTLQTQRIDGFRPQEKDGRKIHAWKDVHH